MIRVYGCYPSRNDRTYFAWKLRVDEEADTYQFDGGSVMGGWRGSHTNNNLAEWLANKTGQVVELTDLEMDEGL